MTTVTDPLGHATTYAYDARDRLVAQTAPSGGGTTLYTYDDASRLTGVTDPVGNLTSYRYDGANRVTSEVDPKFAATTSTYDPAGNLKAVVDRDGRTTSYAYDADNREAVEQWLPPGGGPATYSMTVTYDPAGRVTGVQDNSSQYAYGYDNANRLTTVDDQGTASLPQVTMTYGYDNVGNRTSLADTKGGVVSYAYDVRDELATITQSGTAAAPERVDMAYDAARRMTAMTRYSDTAGTGVVAQTANVYDSANRLTTQVNQTSGGATISTYAYTLDAASRLTSLARTWTISGTTTGDTATYGYTDDNQLTGVTHTNSSFAAENLGYDANGNRNTAGYSTGASNQVTTDGTYNYAYDAEGNLTAKTTIATGNKTLYTWDTRNRLAEVDRVVGGVPSVVAQYTYDALDRLIATLTYPTAPAPGDAGFESPALAAGASQFAPTGTPWTFTSASPASTGVASAASGFAGGNPAPPEGTQVAWLNRDAGFTQSVSGWQAGSYTITFQAAQCANYGGRQEDFRVLVDGTPVGTFFPSGTAYQAFTTATFAVAAGTHTVTFQGLDTAAGDNTALVDAVSIAGAATRRATLYDGPTPLLDFDASGTVTARYLSVPGAIDEVLARQTSAGVAWYLTDRLGSVNDIINNSGTVIDHVDYGVYGTVQDETNPAAGDRIKYAGMELDTATGEYYDRARYYDAALGRFMSLDPIGRRGGSQNFTNTLPMILRDTQTRQETAISI